MLPYSELEFDLVRQVVGQRKLAVADPRLASDHFRDVITRYMWSEQAWLDYKIKINYPLQSRIFYSIYESTTELQAYAFENKGLAYGYISVALSLLVHLFNYFCLAMCSPRVFTFVGDASSESWPRLPEGNFIDFIPRDPLRLEIALSLSSAAVRFLTAHELTHILNGHLRLQLNRIPYASIAESEELPFALAGIDYQALEMEADAGAIFDCMTDAFIPCEVEPPLSEDRHFRPWYIHMDLLRIWLIAIYTLLRLLQRKRRGAQYFSLSHPEPVRRLAMILGTLDTHLENNGLDHKRAELQRVFASAMNDAEVAWAEVAYPEEPGVADWKAAMADQSEFRSYTSLLLERLDVLRPQLRTVSNRG